VVIRQKIKIFLIYLVLQYEFWGSSKVFKQCRRGKKDWTFLPKSFTLY
jgi:hypothetical protein